VIDVGGRRRPAVVEVVNPLHAEAAAHLLRRSHVPAQIFEFDLFETDFTAASHVEATGP
jgi:hypothetical protein